MPAIRRSATKILIALAIAAIALAPAASAQTRVTQAHTETASALACLLVHGRDCTHNFRARARQPAQYWLVWNSGRDLVYGALLSWKYVGTEPGNAYTTRFLSGMTPDVYDVRFEHLELTFYIVPPDPDGNIRYMQIREGAPNDENLELFVNGPG
jgi:hypothetical protein